jgi:hypothetical protein
MGDLAPAAAEAPAADTSLELENAQAPTEWELTLAALQSNNAPVATDYVHYYDRSIPFNLELSGTVTTVILEVPRPSLRGTPITTDDLALLLTYVATSAALRTVRLEPFDYNASPPTVDPIFADQLMRAVRSNSNVHALQWLHVRYDPALMTAFLDQAASLQELLLDVSRRVISDEARLIVFGALARNAQITDLCLLYDDDDDDMEMLAHHYLQILQQNTTIQKLHLSFNGSLSGNVWSSLLRSGIPLRCLSLFFVTFDRDAMKGLVEGLIGRGTAIDLILDACFFFNDGIDELIRPIPTMRNYQASTLTISQTSEYDDPRGTEMIEYLLSPFQHLVIDLGGDFTRALLVQLTIQSPPHLESLALVGNYRVQAELEAVVAYVKSAVHLKKLSVDLRYQGENLPATLEAAIRENGSLENVCEGLPRTYCERNANLRLMLERRPMPIADLLLLPSLFQAAKATKKMAAHKILTGLLCCDHLDDLHRGQLQIHPALVWE